MVDIPYSGSAVGPFAAQGDGAGVIDGSNPAAGEVGEFIQSIQSVNVALATGVSKTITSIALTPGDWDISGHIRFIPDATTSITLLAVSASQVTDTPGNVLFATIRTSPAQVPVGSITLDLFEQRINTSQALTVFLVSDQTFTVAALNATGVLQARRVR